MSGLTDEDLNEFRKETGNKFYVPPNHEIFGKIADAPMWLRELFVWKYKKQHGLFMLENLSYGGKESEV